MRALVVALLLPGCKGDSEGKNKDSGEEAGPPTWDAEALGPST